MHISNPLRLQFVHACLSVARLLSPLLVRVRQHVVTLPPHPIGLCGGFVKTPLRGF
uniref:Uncharacterized protein n=1 Tax=Rhizophora mucronata TaxID=61149 RepID=A0A2P2NSD2_RHIMU